MASGQIRTPTGKTRQKGLQEAEVGGVKYIGEGQFGKSRARGGNLGKKRGGRKGGFEKQAFSCHKRGTRQCL